MNWLVIVGSVIGSAIGLTGLIAGLARLFARAELSELRERMAVLESKMQDIREAVAFNYKYCHNENHDIKGMLASELGRVAVIEYRLDKA